MKKNILLITAILIGAAAATSSIASYEFKSKKPTVVQASSYLSTLSAQAATGTITSTTESAKDINIQADLANSPQSKAVENTSAANLKEKSVATVTVKPKTSVLSRGGTLPQTKAVSKTASASGLFKGKNVELLDWWKSGRYAFPIGSVVTVKDVYTGKTFKIKRTMGENHADCEALTLEDTKIIKSIWGGFSWDVRPIHIYINGRVLAASMAGQPHAGVDSAPAFAVVKNRSEDYGTGENLDTIKGNGMDGHFDVHFLNSTRHKDGEEDPRHQAAVKVAAAKGE